MLLNIYLIKNRNHNNHLYINIVNHQDIVLSNKQYRVKIPEDVLILLSYYNHLLQFRFDINECDIKDWV